MPGRTAWHSGVFLFLAIEVAMLVAAWAGQILVDLVIAVDSGNRLGRNSSSDSVSPTSSTVPL
jgi:hypothetical protein